MDHEETNGDCSSIFAKKSYGFLMASGKIYGGWLSGDLETHAKERIKTDFGGNQSAYVVALVTEDKERKGGGSAPADNVLAALAERFHPTIAKDLKEKLRGKDQALVLHRMLDALHATLSEANPLDPSATLVLTNPRRMVSGNPNIVAALVDLAREFDDTPSHESRFAVNDSGENVGRAIPSSPASAAIEEESRKRREAQEAGQPDPSTRGNTRPKVAPAKK